MLPVLPALAPVVAAWPRLLEMPAPAPDVAAWPRLPVLSALAPVVAAWPRLLEMLAPAPDVAAWPRLLELPAPALVRSGVIQFNHSFATAVGKRVNAILGTQTPLSYAKTKRPMSYAKTILNNPVLMGPDPKIHSV
jgi:hypothetical protein